MYGILKRERVAQQNVSQPELTAEGRGRTLPRAKQPLKEESAMYGK